MALARLGLTMTARRLLHDREARQPEDGARSTSWSKKPDQDARLHIAGTPARRRELRDTIASRSESCHVRMSSVPRGVATIIALGVDEN